MPSSPQHAPRSRRAPSRVLFTSVVVATLASTACATTHSWGPPPPRGETYRYDEHGYLDRGALIAAGTAAHGVRGAGFESWARRGTTTAQESTIDAQVQRSPRDGTRFNEQLGEQGTRVAPAAPVASTGVTR